MRKFFSGITFFLFVFFSVPLLFLFTLSRTYLSFDFYQGPFLEKVYSYIPEVIAQQVHPAIQSMDRLITYKDVEEASLESFDQNTLQTIMQETFEGFRNLDKSNFILTVNLQTLEPSAKKFLGILIEKIIERKPTCLEDENPESDKEFIKCVPEEWRTAEFKEQFSKNIDEIFERKAFENGLKVLQKPVKVSFEQNIDQILLMKDMTEKLPQITLFILFFLTFIVFLLRWKPWSQNFSYIGKMFISSAVFCIIIGVLMLFSPALLKPEYFSNEIQNSYETFHSIYSVTTSLFAHQFLFYSTLLFILGLVLLLVTRRNEQRIFQG